MVMRSPGVYPREIDLSHYAQNYSQAAVAMVGVSTKGPVNDRTLLTSTEDWVNTFGPPVSSSYASYAALEYLEEGNILYFVRVESSTSPAVAASATIDLASGSTVDIDAKYPGSYYNDLSVKTIQTLPRITSDSETTTTGTETTFTFALDEAVKPGTVIVKVGGTKEAVDDGAGGFTNEAGGSNPLDTGASTIDYDSGAVSLTFDSAITVDTEVRVDGSYYSAFTLQLVKTIQGRVRTIEEFGNLSLASTSDRYYKDLLKLSTNIDYDVTIGSLPTNQTVAMTGGDDGLTGIGDDDYIGVQAANNINTGMKIFDNEDLDYNTLCIPGNSSKGVLIEAIDIAERHRAFLVVDPPDDLEPDDIIDWADGSNAYAAENAISTSYAGVYYPWLVHVDNYNEGVEIDLPPSGYVLKTIGRTLKTGRFWDAPAGLNRGLIDAKGSKMQLNQGDRDLLYTNRINPINDFVAHGIRVWGQKTAQTFPSALDRVGTRYLLNMMERSIIQLLMPFVFELNNERTWRRAELACQSYLNGLIANEALYRDSRAVCNSVTNPPEVIEQNKMVVNLFLKPTKYAEEITVNFIILSTGANVDEYVGLQF